MKQIVKYLLIGLVGTFFLTGCSSKYNAKAVKLTYNDDDCEFFHKKTKEILDISPNTCEFSKDNDMIGLIAIGDSSSFTATAYNNSTFALLQAASEATIKDKHTHFAFVYPETISNMHGALESTAEEFQKKCEIGIDDLFTFSKDPCKIHIGPTLTYGEIAVYDNEQEHVITYDAQKVLAYIKKNDLYDENVDPILQKLNDR